MFEHFLCKCTVRYNEAFLGINTTGHLRYKFRSCIYSNLSFSMVYALTLLVELHLYHKLCVMEFGDLVIPSIALPVS